MTGYSLALACLALNIYHEAAFEPPAAQLAVAFVTINRTKAVNGDICETVFKPWQFSWANKALDANGKLLPSYIPPTNNPRWLTAQAFAKITLSGQLPDNTGGATFYHANYIPAPYWTKELKQTVKLGKHIFYRELDAKSARVVPE